MKNSSRDLGAHINMTNTIHSTTLSQRLTETTAAAGRLDKLPLTHSEKAFHIRTRMT